jgi:hypothetical protein
MYPKIDVQADTNNVLHDKNHTYEKKVYFQIICMYLLKCKMRKQKIKMQKYKGGKR